MALDWKDSPDLNHEKKRIRKRMMKNKNENDAVALILVLFCDL